MSLADKVFWWLIARKWVNAGRRITQTGIASVIIYNYVLVYVYLSNRSCDFRQTTPNLTRLAIWPSLRNSNFFSRGRRIDPSKCGICGICRNWFQNCFPRPHGRLRGDRAIRVIERFRLFTRYTVELGVKRIIFEILFWNFFGFGNPKNFRLMFTKKSL